MANCENCGAPLKPGARQCEFCGSEVNQNKNIRTDGISININTPSGGKSNININISGNNYVDHENFSNNPMENFDNEFFHNNDTPEYDTPQPEPSPRQEPSPQPESSPQQEPVPQPQYDFPVSPKSKWLDFTLALLGGHIGIHKFYEGKIFIGILYFLTLGLFGFGWIADVILILLNKATDKNGLPIVK